ncbi:MAG: ROK family protein [Bacilli bacterium]
MKNTAIAIDCGGTNLRVAVVDEDLNILSVRRTPTVTDNPNMLYSRMHELIDEVAAEANVPVLAIGMSICGIVVHNHVGKCGNLGIIDGFDFLSLFQRDYPQARLKFANDANCSALVEALKGVNKDLRDSAFVTISSGIGLGVVHNMEMIDLPLEGGRLMQEYEGKYYESEFLLSGNGIIHLCSLNGIDIASAKEFFDGIRAKDAKLMEIYNIWVKGLGIWFGNLQLLFDCEQYALSGGVMKSKDVFLDDLTRIANASVASWHLHPIVLKDAAFKQDVGIAAAGSLGIHELLK